MGKLGILEPLEDFKTGRVRSTAVSRAQSLPEYTPSGSVPPVCVWRKAIHRLVERGQLTCYVLLRRSQMPTATKASSAAAKTSDKTICVQ